MSTKKLIVEVEVQNAPDVQRQMQGIEDSLKRIADQNAQLLKTTRESADVVVRAHSQMERAEAARAEATERENRAAQEGARAERERGVAMRESGRELEENARATQRATTATGALARASMNVINAGTKLLRMYALMSAANEEDAQAMIRKIAYFESLVQGINGVTMAAVNAGAAMQAFYTLQAQAAAGARIGLGGTLALGAGRLAGMAALPVGVAAAGVMANRAVWGRAHRTGGGSYLGGVSLREPGSDTLVTGWQGDMDEGILSDGTRQKAPWQGGERGVTRWIGETMAGGSPYDDRDRFQRPDQFVNDIQRQKAFEQAGEARRMAADQYKARGSWADQYGSMAQGKYLGGERSERVFKRRERSLKARYDLGAERQVESMAPDEQVQLLQDQWKTVQALAGETARAEEEKHNKALDSIHDEIQAERELHSAALERYETLRETTEHQKSGHQKFLSLDPIERQQAIDASKAVEAGTATSEQIARVRGFGGTEAYMRSMDTQTATLAYGAGYGQMAGRGGEETLDKFINDLNEIGELKIKMDTSSEHIVKLEGDWKNMSESVGEKIQEVIETKFGDMMEEIIMRFENIENKMNP